MLLTTLWRMLRKLGLCSRAHEIHAGVHINIEVALVSSEHAAKKPICGCVFHENISVNCFNLSTSVEEYLKCFLNPDCISVFFELDIISSLFIHNHYIGG